MKSALQKIPSKVNELILNHTSDLEEAWSNVGDEGMSISFPVKIGFKNSKALCEVGIQFVKEKVKDSTVFEWDDRQLSLIKSGESK